MVDQPRPVWLDKRLAAAIAYAKARAEVDWNDEGHVAELGEILNAWDKAPSDAVDIAARAIYLHDWGDAPDSASDLSYARRTARPVLRALGKP